MSEVRIPGFSEGSAIGGEPANWLVFDTVTKERRVEPNPAYIYVEPVPLTPVEQAREYVEQARLDLDAAEGYLRLLLEA